MKSEEFQINDSFFSHLKKRQIDLYSTKIKNKKKIYLDTNYWIYLRDQYFIEERSNYANNIISLYDSGKFIFPISDITFLEVLKQTDINTRNNTIELIDKLSDGITSITTHERLGLEVMNLIGDTMDLNLHDINEIVFTKLSFILGYTVPPYQWGSVDNTTKINSDYVDYLWDMPLKKIVSMLDLKNWKHHSDNSEYLNREKEKHFEDHKSFKSLYLGEIYGSLDAQREILVKAVKNLYHYNSGDEIAFKNSTVSSDKIILEILKLFKDNQIGSKLPFIDILGGLFASVRWDKPKKHHKNDTYDFILSSFALPYCDYSFTEKPLNALLTNGNLSYDKKYNCNVLSKFKEVDLFVEELTNHIGKD